MPSETTRRAGFGVTLLAISLACGCGDAGKSPVASAGNAGAGGSAGAAGSTSGGVGSAGDAAGAGVAGKPAASQGGATAGSGGAGGSVNAGGAGTGAGAGGQAGQAGGGPSLMGAGTITYERWEGIKGEDVSLVPTSEPPDVTLMLSVFQMPNDVGQDFGARLRGYLTAPVSGDYTFWISCDDNGELSLSPDAVAANKQRIAYVSGSPAWTDYVEWTKFATQKSAPITLVAGKRYYVEALLKEDIAEDHLAVGWSKPGDVSPDPTKPFEIVPGTQLSPIE